MDICIHSYINITKMYAASLPLCLEYEYIYTYIHTYIHASIQTRDMIKQIDNIAIFVY
jgi:hypothetical protein